MVRISRLLLATALAAVGLGGLGVAVPAVAAAADKPDLQVTAKTDKQVYAVGDAIIVTYTLKNVGTVAATNVLPVGGDSDGVNWVGGWEGGWDGGTPGPTLAPGASIELVRRGTVNAVALNLGRVWGAVEFGNDAGEANDEDNTASFRASVPGAKNNVVGKVFEDITRNFDETQPGLAGVKVTLSTSDNEPAGEATTDANGMFRITDLPAGDYVVRVPGWKLLAWDDHNNLVTEDTTLVQVLGESESRLSLSVVRAPASGSSSSASSSSSAAAATSSSTSAASTLPVTGDRTALVGVVGVVVIALGAVAVLAGRRRRLRFVADE